MHLIKRDLDCIAVIWNTHHIRARKQEGNIPGIPDKMFYLPNEFDTENFAAEFNLCEIEPIETELEMDSGQPCLHNEDFIEIVNIVCPEWDYPTTVEEAQELYIAILCRIAAYEN